MRACASTPSVLVTVMTPSGMKKMAKVRPAWEEGDRSPLPTVVMVMVE
jgi:hypothetical protein